MPDTESFSFTHLVLLGALLDAGAGLAVVGGLVAFDRRRLRVVDVLLAVLVSGTGAAVQTQMVGDGFGRLHVAYLWVFVTLPIMGAALLAASAVPALRPSRRALLAPAALVALAPVGFYATHIEPYWLRTDRAALDVAAVDGEPIRLGVLTDLQTNRIGDHERDAIDRLMAEEPDVIVMPGDIFQSNGPTFEAALPELRALLSELEAPGGVWLVEGDVDSPGRLTTMTEGLDNIEWIDGEVVTTTVRGVDVHIAGIPIRYYSEQGRATLADLEAREDDGSVRIVLAHRPDVVDLVPEGGADLVVAGHTHGGQVQLPFFGAPITLSGVPRDVAGGGLHEVGGQPIYLSTGVGLERASAPQVRLFARPSVGIVTLR